MIPRGKDLVGKNTKVPRMQAVPDKIWRVIASFCPDGATWKAMRETCSIFRDVCEPMNKDMVDRFCNPLLSLLKKFPKKKWSWKGISQNPNVSWEFVKENPDLPWDWIEMSRNVNLRPGMMYIDGDELKTTLNDTKTITWDTQGLASNPAMTELLMSMKHGSKESYIYSRISAHVPIDVVRNNPQLPWSWFEMSVNPNVMWEFVLENEDKPWRWDFLSSILPCDVIFSEPDRPWSWDYVAMNPDLTLDMIKKHHDKPWNFENLSIHRLVTLDVVRANMDKKWDWGALTRRASVGTVLKNPGLLPWDWSVISHGAFLKLEDAFAVNKHEPHWDWSSWNMSIMSWGISATYSEVCEHSSLWRWDFLSWNKFRKVVYVRLGNQTELK